MSIIYMATNTITNKSYIGKTVRTLSKRKNAHLYQVSKLSNTYFHNAIRKYGKDAFEWIVLEEVSNVNINNAEMFWIEYFRYIGAELYNLTDGGEGVIGYKHTLEHHNKMRSNKRRLGKTHNEESKTKISQSLCKKTYTLLSPEGNIIVISNINTFCKENNLVFQCMYRMLSGQRSHYKGWTLL